MVEWILLVTLYTTGSVSHAEIQMQNKDSCLIAAKKIIRDTAWHSYRDSYCLNTLSGDIFDDKGQQL
jgi:hypothetical protein